MNLAEIRKRVEKILDDAECYEDTADGDVLVFETHEATEKIIELLIEICPTLRTVDPPSALVGGGNSENSAGN